MSAWSELRAQGTFDRVDALLGRLQQTPNGTVIMDPAIVGELDKYLGAHRASVERLVESAGASKSLLHKRRLAARLLELERALDFVEHGFVKPREGELASLLGYADRLCIDSFRVVMADGEDHPIGPPVAISPGRAPALWAPGSGLSMPTLFQRNVDLVNRGDEGANLGFFPIVCMPSDYRHRWSELPLLVHEVGHAIDGYLGISADLSAQLGEVEFADQWNDWMPELFADLFGLIVAGEAFALCLASAVELVEVMTSAYPRAWLRVMLLADVAEVFGGTPTEVVRAAGSETNASPDDLRRLAEWKRCVRDDLLERLGAIDGLDRRIDTWSAANEDVRRLAAQFGEDASIEEDADFVRAVSAVSLATRDREDDAEESLKRLAAPAWAGAKSKWRFRDEIIPTLRATIIDAADGQTKTPPRDLLRVHDRIAFVGCTNDTLLQQLGPALADRGGRKWTCLEVFFLTDAGVEAASGGGAEAIAARDRAKAELRDALASYAEEWRLFDYDVPFYFASYWDWERPGGRIHVSPGIWGQSIKSTPGTDHLWTDSVPSVAYRAYARGLEALRKSAKSA